jgi:hypothetical protein
MVFLTQVKYFHVNNCQPLRVPAPPQKRRAGLPKRHRAGKRKQLSIAKTFVMKMGEK